MGGSGKSKTTALNILSSSSLSGLTTTEKSGPKVTYDREEILLYAEHYTTLPADLEGTTLEVRGETRKERKRQQPRPPQQLPARTETTSPTVPTGARTRRIREVRVTRKVQERRT